MHLHKGSGGTVKENAKAQDLAAGRDESCWEFDIGLYGPTRASVAAARAAQQRERAAFTKETGFQVSPDGLLLRPETKVFCASTIHIGWQQMH
jgi:hypothetical protein